MANTTNFNWATPDDTDLVKDGAAAIRTLGSSIDTTLVDLKGGTTGQVLSKTTGTDMDFTWVDTDDANAIQNAIVDAKGDLIAASANDTPARLAVGNNGETLVADSSASTGLRWQGNFAAGKNALINGDYRISQRGTSFSITSAAVSYTLDRWNAYQNGNGTMTVTQEAFTAGTAPVAGYEGSNFARVNISSAGTTTDWLFRQPIEDVRTFAGQTVTLSFWAKASATQTIKAQLQQVFGSGGSGTVSTTVISSQALTSSWVRYSASVSVPSISGKTLGTGSNLLLQFSVGTGGIATGTVDFWGVQLEAGSVATPFTTATGTLAGELAACQRYYIRIGGTSLYEALGTYASAYSTTIVDPFVIPLPVRLRSASSSSLEAANIMITDGVTTYSTGTFTMSTYRSLDSLAIKYTHGSAALTAYRPYLITANNSTSAYIGYSAEL